MTTKQHNPGARRPAKGPGSFHGPRDQERVGEKKGMQDERKQTSDGPEGSEAL
jgi:hypothetical protein